MTLYDWICSDCEAIWEQDHPIGGAPKKTKCPECGELRERNWASVSTFRMKGDCHTNRVRLRDRYDKGMDKDTAEEFYDTAIKSSKRSIDTGWKNYKKYEPNLEAFREKGLVRRRSAQEAQQVKENAKKLTEAVYNDRNIDIQETIERKPQ